MDGTRTRSMAKKLEEVTRNSEEDTQNGDGTNSNRSYVSTLYVRALGLLRGTLVLQRSTKVSKPLQLSCA